MTFMTTVYKKEKTYKTLLVIACIGIILISSLATFLWQRNKQLQKDNEFTNEQLDTLYKEYEEAVCILSIEEAIGMAITEPLELTEENLYYWLLMLDTKHADVLMAQAQIESHIGKSNLGKNANNLFGMKYSKNDKLAIGKTDSGFAIYKNWQHSVIARILWDEKYNNTVDTTAYIEKLCRVYATDTHYKEKLLKTIK